MPDRTRILHRPTGLNDPYQHFEYERIPRWPVAGDFVLVRAKVQPNPESHAVFLQWTVNGETQRPLSGRRIVDHQRKWDYVEFELGRFQARDEVSYRFEVASDEPILSEWFSFTVGEELQVGKVREVALIDNAVKVVFEPVGGFHPHLYLSFENGHLRVIGALRNLTVRGVEKHHFEEVREGHYTYYDTPGRHRVEITREPFRLAVIDGEANVVFRTHPDFSPMEWTTGGRPEMALRWQSDSKGYYGFGERYDSLNQRGLQPDICVYNQYLNQKEQTYIPIPFFVSEKGFGVYIDSARYMKFDLGANQPDALDVKGAVSQEEPFLEMKMFFGTPQKVLRDFLDLTGMPALPPKWVFGPWMSGNSWNTQREVVEQVELMNELQIPATVIVVEAWSDEATFYIINDAKYELKPGSEGFSYSDFRFGKEDRWPDFKGMIDFVHSNGLKFILWQIPVLKYFDQPENEQHVRDQEYAIQKGYCVLNADGIPYRITDGWFAGSLLLDFTNPEAREWWFKKRQYLLDDLHVDGFKTDGGEFIFHDDLRFWDGSRGDWMRNLYPVKYIEAYHEFQKGKGITFSRAGFTGAQKYPLYWGGDQISTWESFRRMVIAGLTMSASGNPFWGWDIAGFSGEVPTAELFIRSTQMAAFCPVMQFHSESRGEENWDRSPWNIAARTGDQRPLDIYRLYANLRMNLLPYIYREAMHCARTGEPLMRPLAFDYPDDVNVHNIQDEYLFGRTLLVAPVVEEGRRQRDIYLPEGVWVDFWSGKVHTGPKYLRYNCDLDRIPVFIKNNSVIPLNLNERFELGGYVGNRVDSYENLSFLVVGEVLNTVEFEDDLGNKVEIRSENGRLKARICGNLRAVHLLGEDLVVESCERVGGTNAGLNREIFKVSV